MKSFGKTFRTFLAMSLALCMVMSCVTVSADETKVSLTVGTPTTTPVDGYYTVTATVDGLVAGNSATILVHKEEAPTNGTIGYANQDVIAEGQTSKTFTMELKKGEYKVLAGGTGKTAAQTATLVIEGVAPAFAESAALVVAALDDKTAVEGATVVANFPKAEDADKEEVTYSIGGDYAAKFSIVGENIVLAEALSAGNYPFTLIATAGGETAALEGTLVVASTTVYVKPADIVASGNAGYASTADTAKAYLPATVALVKEDGSATDKTVGVTYENGAFADGKYTYDVVFGELEEGFAWVAEANENVKAFVLWEDDRSPLDSPEFGEITVQYGHDLTLPTYDDEYLELASQWKCAEGDFSSKRVGKYTFTNGVNVKADYTNTHKLADDGAVEVVVNVVDERPVVVLKEVADQVIHFGQSAKTVTVTDYTDVTDAELTDWEENEINENTTEYTATLKVNELTHKLDEAGTTEITVSYKVIYEEIRDVIAEIVTDPAEKEVGYNKVPDLSNVKAFANINGKEAVELEFAAESDWTYVGEGEPDMKAIGARYEYQRPVVIDENSYIYADEAVATVVVEVVESRKVISNVKYSVTEMTVPFGTGTLVINEGVFTAAIDGEEVTENVPVVFEGDWTCDGYEAETPGAYTFTRKVVIDPKCSDDYKFDEEVFVEVIVTVEKKNITVENFEYDAVVDLSYGETYSLPETVKVIADDYVGNFDIDWAGVTFNPEALGETTYTGTVIVPEDEINSFAVAEELKNISITVTINYVVDGYEFLDAGKTPMDEVLYVEVGTTLEDELCAGTFPKYLVLKDGDNSIEVEISDDWWNDEGFPASAWEYAYVKLSTENIVLDDNWTWGQLADRIVFTTMTKGSAPFEVKVDGYNKNYVASLNDQPATVTIEGIDGDIPGLATEKAYKFDVDGMEGEWQSEKFVNVASEPGKSKHTVVATIKLQDGTTESQTRYINKYSTLFNGSVYINNTEDDGDSYSAARANKNRDIHVSHDFVFSNDVAGYNFTGTTKVEVFKVVDDKLEIYRTFEFAPGSKSLVIPASEVKEWDNGTYRFVVTYNSENAIIGSKTNARYVYISNNGTWYNSFLINGLSRSGIVIRNNEKLTNKIQLTELGDKGTVWIAHSLKTFGDNPLEVASRGYESVDSKDYTYVLPLTDENGEVKSEFANNGTYKFYTTLKLDGPESNIEDMNIGRVVYIYKQITAINTVAINDSCASDAIIKDDKFEFKPNWYKEARKNEFSYNELTYKLTFVSGLKDGASLEQAVVTDGVEVDGNTIIFKEAKGAETATVTVNADIFDTKVKAELVVEIDGVEDARLPRTFWPKEAE